MSDAVTRPSVALEGLLRRRVSPGRGKQIGVMAILMLAAVIPNPVLAQVVVVQGRVFEFGSRTLIANARVELEGYGATLTPIGGIFRFADVEPGEYTLQVDALGYDSETQVITVTDGVIPVLVPLRVAPLAIDSLVVDLRRIDIRGRVRDAERDLLLVDAEILTDQIPGTLTDANGRFKLEDVLEGVPLRVIVRPYGYLRVDTIFLPDKDETYVFEPVPDPWVEGMIAEQVARLEERVVGLVTVGRPPMDREGLLRYAGAFTLLDALAVEFRNREVDQIPCVIFDERREDFLPIETLLQTTLPEELERVELLFRGEMLRIYTREFMQYMFDRELQLRAPVWVPEAGICF